ncbi:hypothetical protein [Arenicella xantha]|uniref:Uncharacterized protein n=1 Tax=Arenicella xantha TaxID=644221 RepID=A0A395JPC6_9GAMM|nr:hypothetical protein [Arenicella xantha]RBP53459.1 hypothetical protein DFR28_101845 [Arenicella xantha]
MKMLSHLSVASLGLILLVGLTPTTAMAKGSLHLDLPGISIGVHDDHRKRQHRQHYREKRYQNRHYDRHQSRKYDRRSYRHDSYRNDYSRQYYYGGRDNQYRSRSSARCPSPGFSEYYYRNRDCYRHKDHFHCG